MKNLTAFGSGLFLLVFVGMAQAALTTIGTATYGGSDYKLIWDDDNNGNSVIWLDYSHSSANWSEQNNWAAGLDALLTYNIDPSYSVTWTDPAWRLPATVDGPKVWGHQGDPNDDGVYTYTAGYNLANSEMGHLFYTELGNLGYIAPDGTTPPSWGLTNTGDFDNLSAYSYWSSTDYADDPASAWYFKFSSGRQDIDIKDHNLHGLALRGGQVSSVPIPGAVWLLGSGLMGMVILGRRKKGEPRLTI